MGKEQIRIGIGNDHAGVEYKNEIKKYLEAKGYIVTNYGTDTTDSCDYPIYGYKVAKSIVDKENDLGILICGTGVGISLAANKVKGIRACVCSEPKTAALSREHNHTNIIAFGARIITLQQAIEIVDAWLSAQEQGDRHNKRVSLITQIEETGKLDI